MVSACVTPRLPRSVSGTELHDERPRDVLSVGGAGEPEARADLDVSGEVDRPIGVPPHAIPADVTGSVTNGAYHLTRRVEGEQIGVLLSVRLDRLITQIEDATEPPGRMNRSREIDVKRTNVRGAGQRRKGLGP